MRHIGRAQSVFDEYGIAPNYVIDYPIACQDVAIGPLKSFADTGRALIGAHLHPWVSPPHVEELNARNSYPGNLPRRVVPRRPGDVAICYADASRANALLPWRARRDLETICADAWRWAMRQRNSA
jgi:hypothetical protein